METFNSVSDQILASFGLARLNNLSRLRLLRLREFG
jgi:hypothetical protein